MDLALTCATAQVIQAGHSDKQVLLELKKFLQAQNPVNRGAYDGWSESDNLPCHWAGVGCDDAGRVSFLDLSSSNISGPAFSNFSLLTRLTHLDLSANSITGQLQDDLRHCKPLRYLNLSNNFFGGILDVSSLTNLQTLDVSQNQFRGRIDKNFPAICSSLRTLSVASNDLSGKIDGLFDGCPKLSYVDLSWNSFSGNVLLGASRFTHFTANNNNFTGTISSSIFNSTECKLQNLNIGTNYLFGKFPDSIANCTSLKFLSLWDNGFHGPIPPGIGSIAGLEVLVLGSNRFDSKMPPELKNCSKLKYIDISDNSFGGEIQSVIGELTSLTSVVLRENNYTGGIISSGILQLPHLSMLDIGYNQFSGELPSEISRMTNITVLMFAGNNFSSPIPPEYGRLARLQILDLSYNSLSGQIPPEIGNLTSLLLFLLVGNQLSGQIPREIGNCTSLLWFNVAENQLSGEIPPEIANMGINPGPTFMENRRNQGEPLEPITNNCEAVSEWVPASYPEFDFINLQMKTPKNCRTVWIRLATGYGAIPMSSYDAALGYVLLSGNLLSGEIPPVIGTMSNLSLLLLDRNQLSGNLPPEIGQLQLDALNISYNSFSGDIPYQIGYMDSLESLDLSWNNFSGELPSSLNQLTRLTRFNVSYNPLLWGNTPRTGQLSTFDEQSFLGDPLLLSPSSPNSNSTPSGWSSYDAEEKEEIVVAGVAFLAFLSITFVIRELQFFIYLYTIVSRKLC
ncbi:hypothetical protein EJB05_09745, partial [Eragrostis curvula]